MNNSIKDNFNGKSTTELLDILTFSQDDYSSDAIIILKHILKERGVTNEQISECDTKFKLIIKNTQPAQKQQGRITKSSKIVNWVYRIAGLFILAFISRTIRTAIVNNVKENKNTTIWTNEYVSKLKIDLSGALDTVYRKEDAENIAGCVIDKFKANYYYTIQSLNIDTAKLLSEQYTKECIMVLHPKIQWSDKFIKIARHGIINADWFQKVSSRYKKPLCDCIITKLQSIYPDGVPDSITQKSRDSAVTYCAKKIKKSI